MNKKYKIEFITVNEREDGISHTIKAQYQNTSLANLIRSGSYSATGIIEIVYIGNE